MNQIAQRQRFLNGGHIFWTVLALPAIPMILVLLGFMNGPTREDLLHPSGEFAARFMIIAMMLTPLRMLFPQTKWLAWLAAHRRALGVAAFGYALIHTLLYLISMETLTAILAEFWALGIWTGWAAFIIFIPLAVTSNDRSVQRMKRAWKSLHRWVYPAAVLTLVHWIFVHNNLVPALVHFVPLAALELYRIASARKANNVTAS
ncbi:MAG: sulfite oxidase heme-binding subunit YedZ [Pseudomonadales bacterium]